ncbi:Glycosyl transferases group 1 [compost metagenome]
MARPEQVHVVENGFDDVGLRQLSLAAVPPVTATPEAAGRTLVYAGKFRENASPMPLLRAVAELEAQGEACRVVHVGAPSAEVEEQARAHGYRLEARGLVPYLETLSLLRASDVGIVYSEGHPFEATTKIYDYIAVGKPILGIGVHPEGGIHDILKRYGAYRICPNEPEAIASALRDLLHLPATPEPIEPPAAFGRRHQTQCLAEILEQVIH